MRQSILSKLALEFLLRDGLLDGYNRRKQIDPHLDAMVKVFPRRGWIRQFLLSFLMIAGLSACAVSPTTPSNSLTVFAAASLTTAFTDIGKGFEMANPGTKVTFNFAGSQALRAQIEQGAKPDVFASADNNNMQPLKTAGLVGDTPIFTRNRLVVIAPKDNPASVKTLKDLTKGGLKLDIADATVPVGNYFLQALDKLSADATYGADFKTQVLSRVVSKETDVKQIVSKVALGEADAGVVYATDAQAAIAKLVIVDIPDPFNVIAVCPIGVVRASANPALAQKFIDYVLSDAGQAVLNKYGFAPRQ